MNYYYITGTSRGIGNALAKALLNDPDNYVTGISRSQTIFQDNYDHIELDLTSIEDVAKFKFTPHNRAGHIALINNSGLLGDIKRLGGVDNKVMIDAVNVNMLAPMILTNMFIKDYKISTARKTVVNISSGAARHAVPSWSNYCATKAGLEMFAEVLLQEQKELEYQNVRILSIAPGIVDTQMQDEIRQTNPDDFSGLDKFVQLKKNNQLSDSNDVALEIIKMIESTKLESNTNIDLRDD